MGGAPAHALEIAEQSAGISATGFASAATDSASVSSAFFNPSALTRFDGFVSESTFGLKRNFLEISPSPFTPTALLGPSGDVFDPGFVSGSTYSYRLNDRIWLGLSLGTDFATSSKARFDWSGHVYGRSSKIISTGGQPTVAIKVNDWLSIGGGLIVNRLSFANKAAVLPFPGMPSAILDMSDWGLGVSAGVTVTPLEGMTIGLGYRSAVAHRLDGALQVPGADYVVAARVNMPERVNFGLSQRFSTGTTLFGGVEWVNYSRMGTPALTLQSLDLPIGSVAFAMRDIWIASLGVEQFISDRLALRAGFSYRETSSPANAHSIWSAGQGKMRASFGGSYQLTDTHRFDLAYVRGFENSEDFAILPGSPHYVGVPFIGKAATSSNIFMFSLTSQIGGEKKPAARPLVARF
jgi:long-chain fatty acid transport protein